MIVDVDCDVWFFEGVIVVVDDLVFCVELLWFGFLVLLVCGLVCFFGFE